MKKVRIVKHYSPEKLEELINEWVDKNSFREIVDIKYNTIKDGMDVIHYSAMIIYKAVPRM